MPASRLPISAAHSQTRSSAFVPHGLFGQRPLLTGERRQLAGHCAPAFRSVACDLRHFRISASDSATKISEQSKYLILLPLAPFEVLSKFALHFVCGHPG
jgi:hypothetical protein